MLLILFNMGSVFFHECSEASRKRLTSSSTLLEQISYVSVSGLWAYFREIFGWTPVGDGSQIH